jgi:hypothetical protein
VTVRFPESAAGRKDACGDNRMAFGRIERNRYSLRIIGEIRRTDYRGKSCSGKHTVNDVSKRKLGGECGILPIYNRCFCLNLETPDQRGGGRSIG